MPIASDRHQSNHAPKRRGAETASNETPVSTAEQPDPKGGSNTPAARPAKMLVKPLEKAVSPRSTAATGRDHPDESEHPANQRMDGESQKRVAQDGHDKLQDRAAKQREKSLRKAH